ncbi:MAG TPA: DUF6184 family natural product biosynthesis lipoprotein [Polyangiaceae bacterium]|jgi:hypothetical protein
MRNIIVGFVLCCGCGAAVSTTATTSAEFATRGDQVSQEQAVRDISSIRCARELSCGNVGESGMSACERDAREATRAVLITRTCTSVGARELSACLESIRNGRCGTADTMTDRLASCNGAELCK